MDAEPSFKMRAIKAAITRFDIAAQNYSFMGSADPEDRPAIQSQYQRARQHLESLIERNLK